MKRKKVKILKKLKGKKFKIFQKIKILKHLKNDKLLIIGFAVIAVVISGMLVKQLREAMALAVQTGSVSATAVAGEPENSGEITVSASSITPDLSKTHVAVKEKYYKIKLTPSPSPTPKPTATPSPTPLPTPAVTSDKTDRIASFYQGSASWESKLTWSGNWGNKKYKGKKFGAFGCGLCCLANVYSSLSSYRCSPLDMLEFAKESSSYSGSGAIEWWNMKTTLAKAGFSSESGKKPKEYEDFQKIVAKSKAVIVLVGNQNKKSMWEDTTGHYVTLFLYDKKSDQVFLADSGSYARNRHWVPLKKVYQSLKTKSSQQYLAVSSYNKKADTWRNTEFTGKCRLPSNWKTDK